MKKLLAGFIATKDDLAVFISRTILAIVILPHGA